MKKIEIDGIIYSYELSKSRRKSLAILIKPDGAIHVKAPHFVSQREIEGFILQKGNWVTKTIDRISQQEAASGRNFDSGETLPFLGKNYRLTVHHADDQKRSNVCIKEGSAEIILNVNPNVAPKAKKAILEAWYRFQAREIIHEKADYFARLLGVSYSDIRIKDQKSLWGSCSAKGNLNFNWHIVMAPENVLDYLIIHELCHLRFMDHSVDFWQLVESMHPTYKTARKWLKDKGGALKMIL
jgi:predicted metal-dependent hydrolase